MMEVMFNIPSLDNVFKCVITKECITGDKEPDIIYSDKKKVNKRKPSKAITKKTDTAS